jgi:hypothetical protein
MPDSWDDDQLLAALKDAVAARQAVPARFVEAARNAFSWRDIDAELARLAYDSASDLDVMAGLRSGSASVRVLTFAAGPLTIELEVADGALLGQVIPAGPGTVDLRPPVGLALRTAVDDLGCFRVCPVPAAPVRLSYRGTAGTSLLTGWFSV